VSRTPVGCHPVSRTPVGRDLCVAGRELPCPDLWEEGAPRGAGRGRANGPILRPGCLAAGNTVQLATTFIWIILVLAIILAVVAFPTGG
jgi:hypothetical protein